MGQVIDVGDGASLGKGGGCFEERSKDLEHLKTISSNIERQSSKMNYPTRSYIQSNTHTHILTHIHTNRHQTQTTHTPLQTHTHTFGTQINTATKHVRTATVCLCIW
jgi:hypothetical protein